MSRETKSPSEMRTDLTNEAEAGVMPILSLHFIKVEENTTFAAQFAITDGDLVFQFFLSPEIFAWPEAAQRRYWGITFPEHLSNVAKATFNAEFPRLKAQHIYEPDMGINSWWFRAYGFGQLLDPHALAYKFLDALDAALDEAIKRT